jgi:hypothetical protein
MTSMRSATLLALGLSTIPVCAIADYVPSVWGSRYSNWQAATSWGAFFGSSNPQTGDLAQGTWEAYDTRAVGDVNGDGTGDIVGFGSQGVFVGLTNGYGVTDYTKWADPMTPNQTARQYVMDVDGDGKADIVSFRDSGLYVGLSNGTTAFDVSQWSTDFGHTNEDGQSCDWRGRWLADEDGDGKRDAIGVCVLRGVDGTIQFKGIYVAKGDPADEKFAPAQNAYPDPANFQGKAPIFETADVDGDGKADIVAFCDNNVYVAWSQGSLYSAFKEVLHDFGKGTYRARTTGDVNGDGKADIVGIYEYGAAVALGGSADDAWPLYSISVDTADWLDANSVTKIADVNGDGMADIVNFANGGVWFALSDSGGGKSPKFHHPQLWVTDFSAKQNWERLSEPRLLADINADGRPDIVGFKSDGIYVGISAGLYCCDSLAFLDKDGSPVTGALYARAYIPLSSIIVSGGVSTNQGCPSPYNNPLHTIGTNTKTFPAGSSYDNKSSWRTFYPDMRFMMNANFYVVAAKGANGKAVNMNPYLASVPCTTALGYSIEGGYVKSPDGQVHGRNTYILGFPYRPGQGPDAVIEQPPAQPQTVFEEAIAGLPLISNGLPMPAPSGITPNTPRPRSAIGVTKDGSTLIMLTVNSGGDKKGVTIDGLAAEMTRLGAWNALTLDGSGSAQMSFFNGAGLGFQTVGSDEVDGLTNLYRPVPVIFGIE